MQSMRCGGPSFTGQCAQIFRTRAKSGGVNLPDIFGMQNATCSKASSRIKIMQFMILFSRQA
jgi:hypothetical protein